MREFDGPKIFYSCDNGGGLSEIPTGRNLAGHQAVLDVHTGLLAKIALTGNGVWVVHDLDTMEERGTVTIQVPTEKGTTTVPLYKGVDKNKLSATSAEYIGVRGAKVDERLTSFLKPLGAFNKIFLDGMRRRAEALDRSFPPGRVVVAERNTELLEHMLPDLGLQSPQFLYLSGLLAQDRVKGILAESLERQFKANEFWAWNDDGKRGNVRDANHAAELLDHGRLIPKAIALSNLFHRIAQESDLGIVGGLGQGRYERGAVSRGISLPSVREKSIVTSHLGLRTDQLNNDGALPQAAKNWSLQANFRPSATVMYLLGLPFDQGNIEYIE
ncbi:hypothetical protein A3D00_04620 [Candidatus Woesebacteria bacterium RIFCSPHIGHO2_02_FULL_38_9]|uniref:Uncharacterized protein n=1 Tax=Candidatus Woesebacteria bacterium RIFCSPHIGHO2_01_FULL_39_28 TaxID=1802496 RepID=A0A1F7YN14_9BACT|nr:MAG: hypothetical protein A2627_00445 [Candidatus Woesebacteria bacterium RIFCSPHIGHO2_01_FULL_39_28]OGM31911.1 MAG: hypothetical protein A3D00_04620 [Candidatus Woesebacteria bacterium RIFCSPHIGHO2_02_FULL_38_9]OGM56718.1 MAG: hypothetical protein A3A50_05175 [Candidatus Woesebacteria bacterium RIFCSPLOWO2_01_FULL_38_20]